MRFTKMDRMSNSLHKRHEIYTILSHCSQHIILVTNHHFHAVTLLENISCGHQRNIVTINFSGNDRNGLLTQVNRSVRQRFLFVHSPEFGL